MCLYGIKLFKLFTTRFTASLDQKSADYKVVVSRAMVLLLQTTKFPVLVYRGLLLFFLGICFCWVSEALHNIKGEFTASKISFYTESAAKFWISFCCGVASGM